MKNFIRLGFLPEGYDFALLILRILVGVSLFLSHGLQKFTGFSQMVKHFPDPLHFGSQWSLTYAVFCEAFCSLLLIVGLGTRWAALFIAIDMGVAFTLIHKMRLTGEHNGELAWLYLASTVALFFAGAGKFSIDHGLLNRGAGQRDFRQTTRRKFRDARS